MSEREREREREREGGRDVMVGHNESCGIVTVWALSRSKCFPQ